MSRRRHGGERPPAADLEELPGFTGVRTDGQRFFTLHDGAAQEFDPLRSKLAALVRLGLAEWPFRPGKRVLYLGAASGTTARHVADLVAPGSVVAVEKSQRAFRDLLQLSTGWPNLVPVLGDAATLHGYRQIAGSADIVYQDIAQRDQVGIFLRNLAAFGVAEARGVLIVKARSVDVTQRPAVVIDGAAEALDAAGTVRILDRRRLEPFDADHGALLVRRLPAAA